MINASREEYLKEVYFDAVEFFRAKYMEDHVVALQEKMQAILNGQCSFRTHKCGNFHYTSVKDAWERRCYYLAINLGKASLKLK